MNLPRDRRQHAPGRLALILAASVVTVGNAAAAAFIVTTIARRPAALAPGDRLPAALRTAAAPGRAVLLVLGEESLEDYWAVTAAWEIEERVPGSVAIVFAASRDTLRDAVPRSLPATGAGIRWLRRRMPVLPSFVFIDERGRVSATHPAPFAPGLSSELATSFLRGRPRSGTASEGIAADTTSPFLPEIADGRQVVRRVASDPSVVSFLGRHRARARTMSAALHYVDGVGYFWSVEVRVGSCDCSSRESAAVGRLLVRPSDGAILAREFLTDAASSGIRPGAHGPSASPPDSATDLDGRW